MRVYIYKVTIQSQSSSRSIQQQQQHQQQPLSTPSFYVSQTLHTQNTPNTTKTKTRACAQCLDNTRLGAKGAGGQLDNGVVGQFQVGEFGRVDATVVCVEAALVWPGREWGEGE